ncbi:alpha/beta hydrolase [Streptomyces virginiae]|uniref:alpha/beta hydrolase n=1 Tax=Streptomyces virginiae TaxID=1961 RepID=UPI0036C8A116
MGTDARVIRLAAVGTGAAALAALADRAARHRRVLAGRGDERTITVRSGNKLAYRFTDGASREGEPVFVFATGALATMEHWAWLTAGLRAGRRPSLLLYDRPGYGPSRRHRGSGPRAVTAVEDLVELVERTCRDRRLVLIGHDLGAGLVIRAAEHLAARTAGVVVLEPSLTHDDAPPPGDGHENLPSLFLWSLRLGWGGLLATPRWLADLPDDARPQCEDQYRDPRMWQTGYQERTGKPALSTITPSALARTPAPVCLISSGNELPQALPDSVDHHVVRSRPGQLLVSRESALQAASLITAFTAALLEGSPAT